MRIRRREQLKVSSSLMLTPMLDMLTVVLIFLIVNFSPEKAAIRQSKDITLPPAETQLAEIPKIQLELAKDYIKLNGENLEGLNPSLGDNHASWENLNKKLDEKNGSAEKKESILLIADRDTPYEFVDRTVAHLASHGYSDVYLLTQQEEVK
jgi:biopolymer transport protein ExbD